MLLLNWGFKPSDLYNQFGQNQLFDQYEKGEVSSKFFLEQLKPLTKMALLSLILLLLGML